MLLGCLEHLHTPKAPHGYKYPSSHSFPHTPQEEDQELSQVLFSSSSASGVGNRIVFLVLESSGDFCYGSSSFPLFFCKTY